MPFRRQSPSSASWVGVAQDGAVVVAVEVTHAADQRPVVNWVGKVDASNLTTGLQSLQRNKRLSQAHLVGLVPAAGCRLVSIAAPDVPRPEWADALRWSLRDQVDFGVDDAIIDVLEVPQATQLRQNHPTLTVVVPREQHAALTLAADDAGMSWSALEVEETALRNLSALVEEEGKAHALLVFGDNGGLLVITYQGELVMMRHIEVHGSAMTASSESREGALSRTSLEVLRTIDSFERMHSQVSLQGLSVVLPAGSGEEVITQLSELIYVPVQAFALSQWVDLSAITGGVDWVTKSASLPELCALGAALRPLSQARGRQQLKLVDDPGADDASGSWGAVMGLRLAGLAAAIGLLAGGALTIMASQAGGRVQQVEAELANLQRLATAPEASNVTRELDELRRREVMQTQLREVLQGRMSSASMGYSDFLVALGRQSQAGLWITNLRVRGDGRDVELTGRMTNPSALPQYLRRLEQEDRFKGRRFAQIEMRDIGEGDKVPVGVTEFTLRGRDAVDRLSKKGAP